uniref:Uncharacterized protein n=1 Tax=Anguilla anguilla TaxID=7936 RepID=A0A0E9Q9M6_ANGAN
MAKMKAKIIRTKSN